MVRSYAPNRPASHETTRRSAPASGLEARSSVACWSIITRANRFIRIQNSPLSDSEADQDRCDEFRDLVDELCDEFEQSEERGPGAVERRMRDLSWTSSSRIIILRELAMIDIDAHARRAEVPSSSALPAYLERFPDLAQQRQLLTDLIRYEFACLLELGHEPKVEPYVNSYSMIPEISSVLRDEAMQFDSLLLRIQTKDSEYRTHLGYDDTVLGRQAQGERSPFRETYDDGIRRIILAPFDDKRVSRRHVGLSRRNDRQIMVSNLSRKSQVLVHSRIIEPGDTAITDIGSQVRIGQLTIEMVVNAR